MRHIARIHLVLLLALLPSCHRGHGGWTCEWTDGPQAAGQSGSARRGVVSCRHQSMQTFLPQIRRVSCPKFHGACDATSCFVDSIRTN